MKLTALFAKFLYLHKELKLPGVGIFTLDPSIAIPETTDKTFPDFTRHIQYSQVPIARADEEFINFIRTETGKIKPLAESDLDSFLSDGRILLNIGKPFHLEGIGSLMKNREGRYEFTPGEPVAQKHTPHPEMNEEQQKTKTFFSDDLPEKNNIRKILIAFGAIAGIVVIIWAGYSLYHRNTRIAVATPDSVTVLPSANSDANIILDSVQRKIDSLNAASASSSSGEQEYRFIIERTANKARALRRYNQIKETLTDIRLATPDSTYFTLYFVLPAQPSDTARIKDSLKVWYGRKQVWVEKVKS